MTRRFLFFTASARLQGNSERLARRAAASLPEGGASDWFNLNAPALPPFEDLRPNTMPAPKGRLLAALQAVERASDVVFVAPIYWYGLPAPAHLMLSHWSAFLDRADLGFAETLRGKGLWLITARADPDPSVPDQAEALLRRSGEWLGMRWCGALHGVGDAPGDVEKDAAWAAASGFLT
jgi:multimeric flavodoxin WrbA